MDQYAAVPRSPHIEAVLGTLNALADHDLEGFAGHEVADLADFLMRAQTQKDSGARWGDVERLSDLLWQCAEHRTFGTSFFPDRKQVAVYLMEIADLLTLIE